MYTWADVVLAAQLWGDWRLLEHEVHQGLACLKHLADIGDDTYTAEVEAAAKAFRYARDLVTAEAMRAWRTQRGITPEAWMAYMQRSVLRHTWSAALADIAVRYPSDAAEIESCIVAEGICSGRFAQLAYKLAGRAAVHSPDGPAALPQACHYSPEEDQYSTPQACPSAALPSTLLGISPACCQARLMVLASLETGFQRFCAQALTSGAIAHRVSAHSLDWMRFDCHYVVVPTKQMGCEAALCLREDGADLDEVATRASSVLQQSCWYLEQVPPAWRYSLLGARQGAILGPLPMGDAWALCVVREKLLASVHDPDVCQRAEQDVLQGAMACEITRRVRWLVSL